MQSWRGEKKLGLRKKEEEGMEKELRKIEKQSRTRKLNLELSDVFSHVYKVEWLMRRIVQKKSVFPFATVWELDLLAFSSDSQKVEPGLYYVILDNKNTRSATEANEL